LPKVINTSLLSISWPTVYILLVQYIKFNV